MNHFISGQHAVEGSTEAAHSEDDSEVAAQIRELLDTRQVSDATYKSATEKFGEQGVMDLIGVTGYYTLVAMVLNVDRTPIPDGGKPPLPPLK